MKARDIGSSIVLTFVLCSFTFAPPSLAAPPQPEANSSITAKTNSSTTTNTCSCQLLERAQDHVPLPALGAD